MGKHNISLSSAPQMSNNTEIVLWLYLRLEKQGEREVFFSRRMRHSPTLNKKSLYLQEMSQIDLQQGKQGCRSRNKTHSCFQNRFGGRSTRRNVTWGAGADLPSVTIIKPKFIQHLLNYRYGGCYIMLLIVTNNDEHNMHMVTHSPYLDSS